MSEPSANGRRRPLRSFVRREGRLTAAQARAIERLGPRFLVSPEALTEPQRVFGRRAPLVLEVGSGDGRQVASLAAAHPEQDHLAVEVYRPGVGRLLRRLEAAGLDNVRVVCADVNELLPALPPAALDAVHCFFPDPWPKKRHHKRRLIDAAFLRRLARVVRPGGRVAIATDWDDYAQAIVAAIADAGCWLDLGAPGHVPRPSWRVPTRFEERARAAGRTVHEFLLTPARLAVGSHAGSLSSCQQTRPG